MKKRLKTLPRMQKLHYSSTGVTLREPLRQGHWVSCFKAKPSKQTTEPFRKSIQRPILGSPSFPVLASGLERLQRDLALEMFAGISFNQVAVSWHTGIGERLRFLLCVATFYSDAWENQHPKQTIHSRPPVCVQTQKGRFRRA